MPRLIFASAIQRHVATPEHRVAAASVAADLEAVFAGHPALLYYLLDEQGRLRRHVAIFVDGRRIRDRDTLADPLQDSSEVYVVQALSGG